jgi:hypothetical protein
MCQDYYAMCMFPNLLPLPLYLFLFFGDYQMHNLLQLKHLLQFIVLPILIGGFGN